MSEITTMQSILMDSIKEQLCDISTVDTNELGAAIDMIKDLSEAAYYSTVVEAMEKTPKNINDMGPKHCCNSTKLKEKYLLLQEAHADPEIRMRHLHNYIAELSKEIHLMLDEATPEERDAVIGSLNNLASQL